MVSRGHVVSLYPMGPAMAALPLVGVQMATWDRIRPGWDQNLGAAYVGAKAMSKGASACLAALLGVALDGVLRALGLRRVTLPTVLAAMLASNLWAVASQALWQHGPAALALTCTIRLLLPRPATPVRLVLAGLTTSLMVACRSIDLIFALTI